MKKLILWGMLIIPWLSLFFINKHSLKRFMPVGILAALFVTMIFEMGYVFDWWTVKAKLVPWGHITSLPLTYGVFIPGTIWIYHYTFDRPMWVYFVFNSIVDAIYAFVLLRVLIYFEIYDLEKMKHFGIFIMMLIISVIIYVYQKWQDKIMMPE